MTDIENKVIDTVTNAVEAEFSTATVDGRFDPSPASFPFISVEEIDSANLLKYQDNTNAERYTEVTYEVNICTNDKLKKSTAKAIAQVVDTAMNGMKFLRLSKTPTPNIDRTVYRLTMRYSAVVAAGVTKDGTTYYQMYHR